MVSLAPGASWWPGSRRLPKRVGSLGPLGVAGTCAATLGRARATSRRPTRSLTGRGTAKRTMNVPVAISGERAVLVQVLRAADLLAQELADRLLEVGHADAVALLPDGEHARLGADGLDVRARRVLAHLEREARH